MSDQPGPLQVVNLRSLNFYARLGVREAATEDEIRKAHKRLLKRIHPDLNSTQGEDQIAHFDNLMKAANEARDTLLDPQKRAHYAQRRRGPAQQRRSPSSGRGKRKDTGSRPYSARRKRQRRADSARSADGSDSPDRRPEGMSELVYRALDHLVDLSRWHRRGP